MFLTENEFFDWAINHLKDFEEITIISQTPIMFFKEEQDNISKKYLRSLLDRFENENLKTTYYMSQTKIESKISPSLPLSDRIDEIREWQSRWDRHENISAFVVKKGYFPQASLWIDKEKKSISHILIKINFENTSKVNPVWLSVKEENSKLDNLLNILRTNSITFSEYLDKRITEISSLEP